MDILQKDSISLNLEIENKDTLLNHMMELAEKSGSVIDREEALREIFKREKIMSTGVGKGIALPHAKTDSVNDSIAALATLKTPIDFDALDGEPVNLVLLILGRENNVGAHLRLLSKVSRFLNNDTFRSRLQKSTDLNEVYDLFNEIEELD